MRNNGKMAKGKGTFERLWRREAEKVKGKEAMRKAAARAAKRRSTERERSGVKRRGIKKEAKQQ